MKRNRHIFLTVLAAFAAIGFGASFARADQPQVASFIPDQYRNVGVTEHPDAQIPLDLQFYDERANTVRIGDFFKTDRPIILQLGYYDCPKLCDVVSRDLIDSAKQVSLDAGADYQFIFVSINPAESPDLAQMKKQSFVDEYGKPGTAAGFHCLVGKQRSIDAIAAATGFRYNALDHNGQYAHPAVLFVLTPSGRISRYLYGVNVPPRTLKLSLVEASAGKIGSSFDRLALMICCYDVATGRYAMTALAAVRITAVGTLLVLGFSMLWLFRHGSRVHAARQNGMSGGQAASPTK